MWTIWRAPTNASKLRMGFNSAFKGLTQTAYRSPILASSDDSSCTDTSLFYRLKFHKSPPPPKFCSGWKWLFHIQWAKSVLSLGIRWLEHETNHSLTSIGEVKNEWLYASTCPQGSAIHKANFFSVTRTKRHFRIQAADDVKQNTVCCTWHDTVSPVLSNTMQLAPRRHGTVQFALYTVIIKKAV